MVASRYCVLDEAGDVMRERSVPTTKKGMDQAFAAIPRSRVALETGAHSPWVSRRLTQWGHEVIVAHARNVRLIGESTRKDDACRNENAQLAPSDHRSTNSADGRMATEAARFRS